MLYFLLAVIIVLLYIFAAKSTSQPVMTQGVDREDAVEDLGCLMVALIASLIAIMMLSVLLLGNHRDRHGIERVEILESEELVALTDNIGTEGSFVLGSGKVKTEHVYTYMVKNERGNGVIHTISGDNIEIDTNDAEPPRIEWQRVMLEIDPDDQSIVYLLFFRPGPRVIHKELVVIHVPPGAITYDYEINLK